MLNGVPLVVVIISEFDTDRGTCTQQWWWQRIPRGGLRFNDIEEE
jgi:hypothetical protein